MADRSKEEITRRRFVKGAAVGIGGAALVGLGALQACSKKETASTGSGPAGSKDAITWRMQSYYPHTNSTAGRLHWEWARGITEVTGGRLKVECNEPNSIVPAGDIFQNVADGTLDVGGTFGPVYRGLMPEADIEAGLPFAWERIEELQAGFYKYGLLEEFRKIYAEHNIFYATPIYVNVMYGFPTVRPVRKPADFKGMKMRDLGLSADWVAHYGAVPTSMPPGEVYMALKMNTIQGVHFGTSILDELKIGEVCKYYLLYPNTGKCNCNVLINMKAYNALPEDLKAIVKNYSINFTLPAAVDVDELRYFIEARKKYKIEEVRWSQKDIDESRAFMIEKLWPKAAAKSERCKKLVDIVYNQVKFLGKV